ncbi:MAG: carboxypeptidase-like regulatory domain-containing protein [Bryobacteraceae bacterium]
MRHLLLLAFAPSLWAGLVQGIAVERLSGFPLGRTRVRLDRVVSSGLEAYAGQLTTRGGRFLFNFVPDGLYMVTVARDGYTPMMSGTMKADSVGRPFIVTPASKHFFQIRMQRLGVISGFVLDENRIGIRNATVHAYPAGLPLRSVATAVTDDRGAYRLHGLQPGTYHVRTASHRYDDGDETLPTFAPESLQLRYSRTERIRRDMESEQINVRPILGKLFSVGGLVRCAVEAAGPVVLTLSSDSMRRQTSGRCNGAYAFEGVAPGYYEISALIGETASGFFEQSLEQRSDNASIEVQPFQHVDFEFINENRQPVPDFKAAIFLRRADAYGAEEPRVIKAERTTLAAGYWEVHAALPPKYYLMSVSERRRTSRPEGDADWFEVFIEQSVPNRLVFMVSDKAARIDGTIANDGNRVAGIPVFLWPTRPEQRRSMSGRKQTKTGAAGTFAFAGLPPGEYKMIASFDFTMLDEDILAEAERYGGVKTVTLAGAEGGRVELSPYIMP